MATTTRTLQRVGAILTFSLLFAATLSGEPLPSRLQGISRITRVLPTSNTACWGSEQAQPLVGSTLTYRNDSLRWRGGPVPLNDVITRSVTAAQFRQENGGADGGASFSQLGIRSNAVLEVDLQHEDMDITGATTEVPGDSVLLAGPHRIVVSACRVFFESTRSSGSTRTNLKR